MMSAGERSRDRVLEASRSPGIPQSLKAQRPSTTRAPLTTSSTPKTSCRERKTASFQRRASLSPSARAPLISSCNCLLLSHPHQCRGSWRQPCSGSQALTESLKPVGHFYLQSNNSDNSSAIYSLGLTFLAASSQWGRDRRGPNPAATLRPQLWWRGRAPGRVCCPCSCRCQPLACVCYGIKVSAGSTISGKQHLPLSRPLYRTERLISSLSPCIITKYEFIRQRYFWRPLSCQDFQYG